MDSLFKDLFETDDTEKYKAINAFYDKEDKNINFKTELSEDEIGTITSIEYMDKYATKEWGIDLGLSDLTQIYKELKVSYNRQGRGEWVEVLKGDRQEEKENKLKKVLGI